MSTTDDSKRRWTAEERRASLVEAAIDEFAQAGLAGARTEAIAKRAGVSHAYLFRLFGTKRDLFMAAVDRSFDHIESAFQAAAAKKDPDEPLFRALGQTWTRRVADRRNLLFHFHVYAACADEDVRRVVERRYMAVLRWVRETSGRSLDDCRMFMAAGLLISVGAAIGNPELSPDGSWTARVNQPDPPTEGEDRC